MTTASPAPGVSDNVAAALAAADALAKQAPAPQAPAAPATGVAVPTPASAPAVYTGPATRISFQSAKEEALSVDIWLKVKEFGLLLGDNAQLLTAGIPVLMEIVEGRGFLIKRGISGGNPAQYAYTLDDRTTTGGEDWNLAIARIQRLKPDARPYRTADLVMKLAEETAGFKAGTVIGYTLPATGWKKFEPFMSDMMAKGHAGKTVKIKLTHTAAKNKNNNAYGILTYDFLEVYEESDPQDQDD